MNKKLYISKKVQGEEEFKAFCAEKEIHLIDVPMISFKQVEFKPPEKGKYNAIFFSSERSVDFFLTQELPHKDHLLCCIGHKTAKALKKWGYDAHFIGERSGEPNSVAKQLKTFIKKQTILFPQSSISNQSVQKEFAQNQCINLVVYETFALPTKIKSKPDILVFTSPSNVHAFLQMNEVYEAQKVVAWGQSTGHYLRQSNIFPDYALSVSSFSDLQEVLLQELN
jgi:uroporphyrinogen-III synthase